MLWHQLQEISKSAYCNIRGLIAGQLPHSGWGWYICNYLYILTTEPVLYARNLSVFVMVPDHSVYGCETTLQESPLAVITPLVLITDNNDS